MPLVFQDKIFNTDGSLWYDSFYDPAAFRLLTGGSYMTPPVPSCIPEFFGDTMLCNGLVHPYVDVEPKAYRFMMLNACNARFLNLNLLMVTTGGELTTSPTTLKPTDSLGPGPDMIQIGTEGGYLVTEVRYKNDKFFNPLTNTGNMLLGPAERSDFIIDFSGYPVDTEFILYNDAPGPFPGGPPTTDFLAGNLSTPSAVAGSSPDTRQLLKFRIKGTVTHPEPPPPRRNSRP